MRPASTATADKTNGSLCLREHGYVAGEVDGQLRQTSKEPPCARRDTMAGIGVSRRQLTTSRRTSAERNEKKKKKKKKQCLDNFIPLGVLILSNWAMISGRDLNGEKRLMMSTSISCCVSQDKYTHGHTHT